MWNSRKSGRALTTLKRFGRPHRRWLYTGGLATLGVVLCRLAMPWPLRGVVEIVFPGSAGADSLAGHLPARGDPVLWLAGLYMAFAVGCGLFELLQRTRIMTFAAWTVHDLRASAVDAARSPGNCASPSGELVARIIGDTARVKAGLSGILVHVLQNGLLFLGVTSVLTWISPPLGLVFLTAGLLVVIVGVLSASPVASTAEKQRRKEGEYAAAIHDGLDSGDLELELDDVNLSSAKKDVKVTRLVALSSLLVHTILAAMVGLALWIGAGQVRGGTLAPGELFLFIAYALTVHRRLVQVGRQLARSGKVLACAHRIAQLLDDSPGTVEATGGAPSVAEPVPLGSRLRLDAVRLKARGSSGRKSRLRRTELSIPSGSRVAVVGDIGAGKSSLLRVLAGVEPPHSGRVLWDEEVTNGGGALRSRVEYLAQDPVFPPRQVSTLLRSVGAPADSERTLRRIGAWNLVRRLSRRPEEKVGSARLSRHESRVLLLSGILLGGSARVWVLDGPLEGMREKQARECLEEVFIRAGDRTVILSLSELIDAHRFDRVLCLKRGRVSFYGTLATWKQRKRRKARSGGEALPPQGKVVRCKR